MKNLGKKFLSLLVALTFILTSAGSVFAYDTTVAGIDVVPQDVWSVTETFHWVVRGDTLDSIADKYGTTVADIKAHNAAYFNDLDLRNRTTGLNVLVENGVRLKIYDQVQVKHYVQRGDTLEKLANGSLRNGSFVLTTTVRAIQEENVSFFASLATLNETMGTNFPLVESDQIFNTGHMDRLYGEWSNVTTAGLALYITVPVHVASWSVGEPFSHRSMTWLENNLETQATVNGTQLPFVNTLPTNNLLVNNGGVPANAWTEAVFADGLFTLIDVRYVTGIYGR